MLDMLRKILGLPPVDLDKRISNIADFCNALVVQFQNRLPKEHQSNLSVISAWWAVALYIHLPRGLDRRKCSPAIWSKAADKVAGRLVTNQGLSSSPYTSEEQQMIIAIADQIKGICWLWIAAFGVVPDSEEVQSASDVAKKLEKLFARDDLELASSFGFGALEDLDEQEAEDRRGEIRELSEGFGLFFEICARSRL